MTHVLCNGESTGVIAATVTAGLAPYTYSWNPGNMSGSIVTDLSAGTYNLTVTDSNLCEVSHTYTITEPSALAVGVAQTNTYTLTATPSLGTPPYSYAWYTQTQPAISLGYNAVYTVSSSGSYYVTVTDVNGCEVTSESFEYGTTGLLETLSSSPNFSIYPNPFTNSTKVEFEKEIEQATISIYDIYGKLIEIHNIEEARKHIIKRTNKASGIYFMQVQVKNKERLVFKLIIE